MKNHQKFAGKLFILSIAALLLTGFSGMFAQPMLHPKIKLLDENGVSVLSSGGAMSTLKSCSGCHDAGFIETHSFHSNLGLGTLTEHGQIAGGREWDFSDGAFGKWNAIAYRYLSPSGDAQIDMGTADWVRYFGARHVGGGPAKLSRSGEPLTEMLEVRPEGTVTTWSWVSTIREGQPLQEPHALAMIRLDGADTSMLHVIDCGSPEAISTGARVRIRWSAEPAEGFANIECFELLEEDRDG